MTFGLVEILVIGAILFFVVGPGNVAAFLRRFSDEADKVDDVVDALPPGMQPRQWQAMRKGMKALDAMASKQGEPDDVEEVDPPATDRPPR